MGRCSYRTRSASGRRAAARARTARRAGGIGLGESIRRADPAGPAGPAFAVRGGGGGGGRRRPPRRGAAARGGGGPPRGGGGGGAAQDPPPPLQPRPRGLA